ncbi:MAG: AbrB/MazE/SpoVT family DNA-binding domain-containing protein [Clostridiales bacterium]|nr:AbrB/MazE/SpoVT family DNA-binding domain-containing protein [Clostridiales bacterium]
MSALVTIPEQKRITISSKRQFTIPQKFFTELGFEREAVCTLGDGMLIIEPVRSENGDKFAEQILADLITEGYSGQELLSEFKARRSKVRPAVEKMLKAAKDAVNGVGEYYSYDDVFGDKK